MNALTRYWMFFWMRLSGRGFLGRTATRLAALPAPPHKARPILAEMTPKGYISAHATISHAGVTFGSNVFIDDRVLIFQRRGGGPVEIEDRVCIFRDTIIETGHGGSVFIGSGASIHPRCQINAYLSSITIGSNVMIAPGCALYPYDHGCLPDQPIRRQPLRSKGPIIIGDEAWIGFGAIILGGVRIGKGAAVGAGSVVTHDVPDGAIVVGNPARMIKKRADIGSALRKAGLVETDGAVLTNGNIFMNLPRQEKCQTPPSSR